MAYTEKRIRNGNEYFYRVVSVRNGRNVSKARRYLGVNLSRGELSAKEKKADIELNVRAKESVLDALKPLIIEILKKNNIRRAGVFGSYARGEPKKGSDIDIVIEPAKNMGFGFAGVEMELSKRLNRKVDLVSYGGLSPYLREKILSQEVRII